MLRGYHNYNKPPWLSCIGYQYYFLSLAINTRNQAQEIATFQCFPQEKLKG